MLVKDCIIASSECFIAELRRGDSFVEKEKSVPLYNSIAQFLKKLVASIVRRVLHYSYSLLRSR